MTVWKGEQWVERIRDLLDETRPIVFVVGSGLSAFKDEEGGWQGVWDVKTVREAIRRDHGIESSQKIDGHAYQEVIERLGEKGVEHVERLFRRAVLAA